jgi:hypothetical protein
VPVQTHSGLELLIVEAPVGIPKNVEITIDYDAQALESWKRRGLTFWKWQSPTLPEIVELHVDALVAAGAGQEC